MTGVQEAELVASYEERAPHVASRPNQFAQNIECRCIFGHTPSLCCYSCFPPFFPFFSTTLVFSRNNLKLRMTPEAQPLAHGSQVCPG